MPEISVNGVRLHYEDVGEGPETVVFSHSYLLDSRHFEKQIEALAGRYRVLAYDHRGHGRSEKPDGGYEMENLYADAVAFLEATGCTPCHWVGLSTGGFIGVRLGFRRPDLLRSLVLMDTLADTEPWTKRIQYKAMLATVRLFGMRPVIGALARSMFGSKFRRDPRRRAEWERWRARLMEGDTRTMVRFGHGIFARTSVLDRMAEVPVPTLVVVGDLDVATPPSAARRIAAAIPGARLEVIPGAGHVCTVEEPERVSRVLMDFLERSSGTGG